MLLRFISTIVVGLFTTVVSVTRAAEQTIAPGPYYATPSWDMTLPANVRFVVLSNFNNEAVLDRETGLVWERYPPVPFVGDPSNHNWFGANERCDDLKLGNRKGWRLPTIAELSSLLDPSVDPPGPTLPAGHPFVGVQSERYWTASPAMDSDPSVARQVDLSNGGATSVSPKNRARLIWCVRGGVLGQ